MRVRHTWAVISDSGVNVNFMDCSQHTNDYTFNTRKYSSQLITMIGLNKTAIKLTLNYCSKLPWTNFCVCWNHSLFLLISSIEVMSLYFFYIFIGGFRRRQMPCGNDVPLKLSQGSKPTKRVNTMEYLPFARISIPHIIYIYIDIPLHLLMNKALVRLSSGICRGG